MKYSDADEDDFVLAAVVADVVVVARVTDGERRLGLLRDLDLKRTRKGKL